MCGIAGIIETRGKLVPKKKLKKMMDSIEHRGPDDEGCFLVGNIKAFPN